MSHRKLFLLALMLAAPLLAMAQNPPNTVNCNLVQTMAPVPQTPNNHLYIPAPGTPNWAPYLNCDFDILDYLTSGNIPMPALNVSGTATFNNVVINGSCSGSGCGGGGSMTWPTGGAGIPNYSGSQSWGTTYTPLGSSSVVQLFTGSAPTAGHFPSWDASGNLIDGSQPSGTGITGTLTPGVIPVATAPTVVADSQLSDNGTTLAYAGTGGLSLTGTGTSSVQWTPDLFANFPACAGGTANTIVTVTDSSTTTWGTTVTGGGSGKVAMYCNGTNWSVFAASGSGGSTSPGGSTTQLQWNNAGAFGGISGWTTNGTTTLTGGASSIFDINAGPVLTGFKPPKAAGAAPTIAGNCAFNSTSNRWVCGDGSTTQTYATNTEVPVQPGNTGFMAVTATGTPNTVAARTLTGTANQIAITNTTGAGDPVFSLIGPFAFTTQTAHGLLIGQATGAITATAVGTLGDCMRSNGSGSDPTFQSCPGGGTVTTSGSPASGNLTKFSGSTAITNGDLSGDITTSGTLAATLATVNTNTGSCGDSGHVCQVTLNGKGLATAATAVAINGITTTGSPASTRVATFSGSSSVTGTADFVFSAGALSIGAAGTSTGVFNMLGTTSGTASITPNATATTLTLGGAFTSFIVPVGTVSAVSLGTAVNTGLYAAGTSGFGFSSSGSSIFFGGNGVVKAAGAVIYSSTGSANSNTFTGGLDGVAVLNTTWGSGIFKGGGISSGAANNATGGNATLSGGDNLATGTPETAGNATVRPGQVTSATPATPNNGTLNIQIVGVKGSTYNVGNLACFTARNTLGDCPTGTVTVSRHVGVLLAANTNSATVSYSGDAVVNSTSSQTWGFGDYVCVDLTDGDSAVNSSSTPCTAGLGVGIAKGDSGAGTTHNIIVILR